MRAEYEGSYWTWMYYLKAMRWGPASKSYVRAVIWGLLLEMLLAVNLGMGYVPVPKNGLCSSEEQIHWISGRLVCVTVASSRISMHNPTSRHTWKAKLKSSKQTSCKYTNTDSIDHNSFFFCE